MTEILKYNMLPTIKRFHESSADIRCIVGPVGSGKTTGASWEVCYYLPFYLQQKYGINKSRWAIVRNTYPELRDTTQRTIFDWFSWGDHQVQAQIYTIKYPDGPEVELLFRSCDNPKHVRQFKSLEITGYWIDESIEVATDVKRMLKNRIGRYPKKSPARFGIETTNPPDVEHVTYSEFEWDTAPPGPVPEGKPKAKHVGFWQPPFENKDNLRKGYYTDLINDYADSADWVDMYVRGKPGIIATGKLVYNNFKRDTHVVDDIKCDNPQQLYRGWDNTGNTPAAVLLHMPSPGRLHVLREYTTARENIEDFTQRVVFDCNNRYPFCKKWVDYADPAGSAEYSRSGGGFTSNAKIMTGAGVQVIPSEQNLTARINGVDNALGRIDGILIDSSCVRLINGFLGGYHFREMARGLISKDPEKNKFSHVHDALQYVVIKLSKSIRYSAREYYKRQPSRFAA